MSYVKLQPFPLLILVLIFLSATIQSISQELKSEEIYKKIVPSVMTLTVTTKDGGIITGTAYLAIRDGVAITAWHVLRNAKSVKAKFSSGEEFEVSGLIDKDEKRDVALIRVKVYGQPLLTFSPVDAPVGSKAYIVGAPKGLEFSISDGIISQIQTIDGVNYYQFTCAASPGNSGGPLVTEKAEVLGVVSWQVRDGQNLNFAVPSKYVLGLDNSLPTVPWLGLVVEQTINHNLTEIDNVLADSFLAICDAGYILNDAYIYLTEEPIYKDKIDLWDLQKKRVYNIKPIPNTVFREQKLLQECYNSLKGTSAEGTTEKIRVIYCEMMEGYIESYRLFIAGIEEAQNSLNWSPEASNLIQKSMAAIPSKKYDELANLQLEMFKVKNFASRIPFDFQQMYGIVEDDSGYRLGIYIPTYNPLYIISIDENGFAKKLGFKRGDTIISIDKKPYTRLYDVKMYIREHIGKRIKVEIMRDGKKKTLTVKLPNTIPNEFISQPITKANE